MDAETIRKTLRFFNFTTTNTILMKLAIDTYLNKILRQNIGA